MEIYERPNDPGVGQQLIPATDDGRPNYAKFNVWATSSRAVGGANTDGARRRDDRGASNRQGLRGAIHTVHLGTATGADGGKFSLRFDSLASITDGTSHTAAFVESHSPDETPRRGTFWSGVAANCIYTGSPKAATLPRRHWSRRLDARGLGSPQNAYFCGRSAGARRSGGMNAAFCDGSARFISETINVGVGLGRLRQPAV